MTLMIRFFPKVFAEQGWDVSGIDPDPVSISQAKEIGVNSISLGCAEDMDLEESSFDLIIIIGSLEHCREPNTILHKAFSALKVGGLIILEGRYEPVSYSYRWLNANHHRFLTDYAMRAFLLKHSFELLSSSTYPVCGRDRSTGRWFRYRSQIWF